MINYILRPLKRINFNCFVEQIGIYKNIDKNLSITTICDYASIAAETVMEDYNRDYAYCTDELAQKRLYNQMIENDFIDAYVFRQVCRLQKRVLAAGVETTEQLDVLRKIKCDEIQGFYYARPMPEAQFIEYVRKSGNHKKLWQRDTENTTYKMQK